MSVGSVTGVLVSEGIVRKIGAKWFSVLMYLILGIAFVLLGLNLSWENTIMAYVVTALLGFPFGATDYNNNLEAAKINNTSGKNRVPALHGGYSIGVLLGAALVGLVINLGMGVTPDFIMIGVIVLALGVLASFFIKDARALRNVHVDPASPAQAATAEHTAADTAAPLDQKVKQRVIWSESKSRHIGFIGFSFVFVEGVGGIWIPIALVQFGFTPADAAFGYTLFGIGFVVVRFVGGWVADKIGLAMCVAAFGDDPTRVGSRMTFLWTLVYVANLVVGPIIGTLSSFVGLIWTLTIPIALMIYSSFASKAVRPEPVAPH